MSHEAHEFDFKNPHSRGCKLKKVVAYLQALDMPHKGLKMTINRYRFQCNVDDPRPVNWPIPHPYWIGGETAGGCATVVAYGDNKKYILENWPEAVSIQEEEVEGYTFTSRFPKPTWFKE